MTMRDTMHRCKYCKGLFKDTECRTDPVLGLVCPNECVAPFQQPPYESPLQDS